MPTRAPKKTAAANAEVAPAKANARAAKPAEPVVRFASAAEFDRFLAAQHQSSGAVLLTLGKAGHPPHITYAEALDVALRWGWIDSQKRKLGEVPYPDRLPRS